LPVRFAVAITVMTQHYAMLQRNPAEPAIGREMIVNHDGLSVLDLLRCARSEYTETAAVNRSMMKTIIGRCRRRAAEASITIYIMFIE
jgi:hypothetical protein